MGNRQYCRYCSFCVDGDALYCTSREKVLKESDYRRRNFCADFVESDLGDARTGKPRTERRERKADGEQEVLFDD